jgi:septum formation protein
VSDPATIVLASASRSRARLLEAAGVAFTAIPAAVDEAEIKSALRAEQAPPGHIAEVLAELKAQRVSGRVPDALVIGADQVLDCEGVLYDKPADLAAARTQLLALRGRTHSLATATCVARGGSVIWRSLQTARLTMRPFSDAFLDAYLARAGDAVTGSCGAYALEGLGAQLFTHVAGDFFAILGLPLIPLLDCLRNNGALDT